jgi:trans-aconitate methyltransferase
VAGPRVPERLRWAVELLEVAPEDQILELGPGPAVSVSLVCERLAGGHITAIDRSATAVQRASRRNAAHVASGKASFHQLDLAQVELVRRTLGGRRFDKAFAVNLNLFWVRPADAELRLIGELLVPGGVLRLVYEAPGRDRADQVERTVTAALARNGFAATARTGSSPSLRCISGQRPARPGDVAPARPAS